MAVAVAAGEVVARVAAGTVFSTVVSTVLSTVWRVEPEALPTSRKVANGERTLHGPRKTGATGELMLAGKMGIREHRL